MHFILFDDSTRLRLLPFTHTRPVADIRCGIWTMRERWEQYLHQPTGSLAPQYMQAVFPQNAGSDNLYINGAIFGTASLAAAAQKLSPEQALVKGEMVIAVRTTKEMSMDTLPIYAASLPAQHVEEDVKYLQHIWDIFSMNDDIIRMDFDIITKDRTSAPIPEGVSVAGKEHIFIEPDAKIYPGCIINATTGPVYIGKQAEVMEGVMIRGPLAACDKSSLKMGAKIYGATTIGYCCKVGGEVSNVVFFANSNKAHDGYLGNAVIGEWCNLGADSNCSNLKNNYEEVKVWDEYNNKSVRSGLIFFGLIMADHSKSGINTMFNTGTIIGVSCNIYGPGFPEKFIPSFSWGAPGEMGTYRFEQAMKTAERVMHRRQKTITDAERDMYKYVFDLTEEQRRLFNNNLPNV